MLRLISRIAVATFLGILLLAARAPIARAEYRASNPGQCSLLGNLALQARVLADLKVPEETSQKYFGAVYSSNPEGMEVVARIVHLSYASEVEPKQFGVRLYAVCMQKNGDLSSLFGEGV